MGQDNGSCVPKACPPFLPRTVRRRRTGRQKGRKGVGGHKGHELWDSYVSPIVLKCSVDEQ